MNGLPQRHDATPAAAPALVEIKGDCFRGWALDRHVIAETTPSGLPTTRRSDLGDRLYRFRHQDERALLDALVEDFSQAIQTLYGCSGCTINCLVAVPVDPGRRDYPRVVEFVAALSRQTGIVAAQYAVTAKEEREPGIRPGQREFAFASAIMADGFLGKTVLVVDDLYRSGRSLNGFCRFLKNQGGAADISVLVGTIAGRAPHG
jgi:predicted amidophosphoribosyltransferase